MTDHEKKARALLAQADKKLSSGAGFFSKLFGESSSAIEDAVELYQQAGNNFKIAKLWTEAGNTFKKAAKMNSNSSKHECASLFIEAGNCYKKNNKAEAVPCFQVIIVLANLI